MPTRIIQLRPYRLSLALILVVSALTILVALAAYPTLDVNTGLTLNEGATAPITGSLLRVSMAGVAASAIRYDLQTLPAHGTLLLNGTPLAPGAGFTQDDLDTGRLAYAHDGSETTSDSFAYRAADDLRQPLSLVSLTTGGSQGNDQSRFPSLSPDGRFIAFNSWANNLVGGDTNNTSDVFVHDRQTGQTTCVSVASNSTLGNNYSSSPALSADGQVVAFWSYANNLVSGDTNGMGDAFVHDRQTGQTTRVSVATGGGQGTSGSDYPTLSADGRFVAFQSLAANLVGGDTNAAQDIFVHDRQTAQTTRVSVATGGTQGNGNSYGPMLSADGRFVVFGSSANNLVSGDTNGAADVFVHDRQTGQTTRVSVASDGSQGNNDSGGSTLSVDGRLVAFSSSASNLVSGDTNGVNDVFVYDRQTGQTTRISVASDGTQGNSYSSRPAISADGRFVTFESWASTLVSDDTNGASDGFVYDRRTGRTTRVSVATDGSQGNNESYYPVPSADRRFIAFESRTSTLVSSDTNGQWDVFVADQGLASTFAITVTPVNAAPTLSGITDQTVLRDGTLTIPFQIGDAETAVSALTITPSSNTPALVPNTNLFLGGAGAQRSLAIQPRAGQTGQATLTLSVSDGRLTTTRSFTLTVQPPPPTPPPPWLALLYLAGDDVAPSSPGQTGLSKPIRDLVTRLQTMPANPAMRLVVLFDGDQTNDSALYVREPGQTGLTQLAAPHLPAWFTPELDSGSVATLHAFVGWARSTYPGSAHTLLSLVDHGGGWAPDPGSFGQPRGRFMVHAGGWTGMALDAQANNGVGTSLSTQDTGEALAGLGRFDVLFFDACLMGMIETATEVQPYADYLVAGENLLWSQLPYQRYLAPDVLTATTDGQALAKAIVAHYNEPLRPTEPFSIAALDLSAERFAPLLTKVNTLAQALLAALDTVPTAEPSIRAAYAAAQKFDYDSSFSLDATDAYVDMADFADQLQRPAYTMNLTVTQAAQQVQAQLEGSAGVVVATKALSGTNYTTQQPWNFAGAHGLSIYLPLGERDCRPTGHAIADVRAAAVAPCEALATAEVGDLQLEPQLRYYGQASQLRFSGAEGAPQWAALLARLDATTKNRGIDRPPIAAPFPATSVSEQTYLPLVRR